MITPRRVKTLSVGAAAYIGGLVDGEGTITLSRLHANERRRLVVSIANTEIQLLEFVRREVGESLTPRNGKYSAKAIARRTAFESQFLAILPKARNAHIGHETK